MNNTEILNNLKNCNDEDNFKKCKELLPLWNNNESTFPSDLSVKNFIKLDKWSFEELNQISTELFINKYLAPHMKDVYYIMKEFRSNSRNELTYDQEAYAKIMGYNLDWNEKENDEDRQNKKATILYEHSIYRFFNNSKLKGNNNDN